MPKLAKNVYYNSKGEKLINCYIAHISKEVLAKTNITENSQIKVYAKDNKIIIEKAQ